MSDTIEQFRDTTIGSQQTDIAAIFAAFLMQQHLDATSMPRRSLFFVLAEIKEA